MILPVLTLAHAALAAEAATLVPPPSAEPPAASDALQTLVISGGCFWGVQGVYQHVKGVESAVSGYAGGAQATASYGTVSTGQTGHAESVKITFDPRVVSAGSLLRIFFSVAHDPTQRDHQGPDFGTQYRSAIFYADEGQMTLAKNYIAQLTRAGAFKQPIVTRVEPLKGFYAAEDYHQDYLTLHPTSGYIVMNDQPKIENLKRLFPEFYNDKPKLIGAASGPS
ncbi:MAG: peptide-methionine (S)-S-oxide reductase MsrA [Methylocella sp.]